MPENARLSGTIGQIDLDFVEREATPKLLMKLSIHLQLAGLSLTNTVSVLEIFGVERVRSTVHNWVHKADLQLEAEQSPNHVAVDETVIRVDGQRYWLYAAVDPDTNELLHIKLEPTRTNVIAHGSSANPARNTTFARAELSRSPSERRCRSENVDDAVFLIDGAVPLKDACQRHGLDFRYERHRNRNSVERLRSQTALITQTQKLPMSGCNPSPSHGISLSEHYRI